MNLSLQEVEEFTGTNKLREQKTFFKRHNIPIVTKMDGQITTTWEVINHVLCSSVDATNEPNFKVMDKF